MRPAILHRTAKKNVGLCAHCYRPPTVPRELLNQYPATRTDLFDSGPEMNWLKEIVDATAESEAIEAINEFENRVRPRTIHDAGLGYCHVLWRHKKRILKEKYGIEWQSPAELNPHI